MKIQFFSLRPRDLMMIPEDARPALMENTRGIIARDESDMPQAICTMDSWSPNSCQVHIWIKNPLVLRHGFREEVCEFVFAHVNKMLFVMPSDNEKVVNFAEKMGCVELIRIKDGFDIGVDYIVSEMNKEDCRYINHG